MQSLMFSGASGLGINPNLTIRKFIIQVTEVKRSLFAG